MLRYQIFDQRARAARHTAASFERPSPLLLTETRRQLLSTSIIDESGHTAALETAREAEVTRDEETLAAAFINDAAHHRALSTLLRYEISLERSLYRALDELRDLQAVRQGHGVHPAPVIDVEPSPPTAS